MTLTQEDREAAADYFRKWHEPLESMALEALDGRHDDDPDSLVQAFTRHRLAAEERGKRMALEAAAKVADGRAAMWRADYVEAALEIATAIRQIDPASLGAE
jgi:hypothetical protein